MKEGEIRIATRGSRLALEQAERVRKQLAAPSRLVVVRTSGDRLRQAPLGRPENLGFFTKEIELVLLEGRADLAVHSLKDLPLELAPGLCLASVLRRDSGTDLLLVHPRALDREREFPLREAVRVGASSRRRGALLASCRPDLELVPIRGNVPTRIEKARRRQVEALIISRAGPMRLGLSPEPLLAFDLNPRRWVGAPGQGVIAVEARSDDRRALGLAAALEHRPTRACVDAERRLLGVFGGGCQAPFGCQAGLSRSGWRVCLAAPDERGVLQLAEFLAGKLQEAERQAEDWLRRGCPPQPKREKAWIAHPAKKWY